MRGLVAPLMEEDEAKRNVSSPRERWHKQSQDCGRWTVYKVEFGRSNNIRGQEHCLKCPLSAEERATCMLKFVQNDRNRDSGCLAPEKSIVFARH